MDRKAFLLAVRATVLDCTPNLSDDARERLTHAEIVYGVGSGSYRGICFSECWSNGHGKVDLIEIAASGEESYVQLACTLVHELGHCLAGVEAAHGAKWKAAAQFLGLRKPRQAGQRYYLSSLEPALRWQVAQLIKNLTGKPAFTMSGSSGIVGIGFKPSRSGPCKVGQRRQVRVSSGPILSYECQCGHRIKSDVIELDVTCNECQTTFVAVSNGKRGRPKKEAA